MAGGARYVTAFTQSDLCMRRDAPQMEYRSRRDDVKTSIHWGQRKLLYSEIEFFTLYWDERVIPNPLCVYAGGHRVIIFRC